MNAGSAWGDLGRKKEWVGGWKKEVDV